MPDNQYSLSELQVDASSGISYRIRVPASDKPARVLVLLHGVGSNERGMVDLALGVDADTLVVCARGPLTMGPDQFAWFRVAFTAEGPRIVPEEAESARQALGQFVESLGAQYSISPERRFIAGFSQGGIMSASVALSQPHLVAGFGLLSGRILPELRPHIAPVEALAHLRVFVAHGQFDSKLPLERAHRADALLNELQVQHALRIYPMDHTISPATHADFIEWLKALHGWSSAQ
jgi:phospholipase/carboxylesterase